LNHSSTPFAQNVGPLLLQPLQTWSSVNRVYDSKARRYAENNRVELNALVNPKPKSYLLVQLEV